MLISRPGSGPGFHQNGLKEVKYDKSISFFRLPNQIFTDKYGYNYLELSDMFSYIYG